MSSATIKPSTSLYRSGLALVSGLILLFGLLLPLHLGRSPALILAQGSTIRYVDQMVGDDSGNDCADSATPCATLQHAVDVAISGDKIRVATGTYTDVQARPRRDLAVTGLVTQVVYISKSLTIRGGYTTAFIAPPDPDANPTTLDAQGQGRVLYITGDISPTIEGLRMTGGDAKNPDQGGSITGKAAGGGVYIISATVTFSNNQVFSNTAHSGGGLYSLNNQNLHLSNNVITGNHTQIDGIFYGPGGGLYISHSPNLKLIMNIVNQNHASTGGGVYFQFSSGAIFAGNTITGNLAIASSVNVGGGLYCLSSDNLTLIDNAIENNTGNNTGGGLYFNDCNDIALTANIIAGNYSGADFKGGGGGLHVENSVKVELTNNTIRNNQAGRGGGANFFAVDDLALISNTIISNQATRTPKPREGGGLRLIDSTAVSLVGNVITDNLAATVGGGLYADSSFTVTLTANHMGSNEAIKGAGAYLSGSHTVALSSNTIISNSAAQDGGGLYLSDAPNIVLMNNAIISNTAGITHSGGGLYLQDSPSALLQDNLIAGNGMVRGSGGGLYVDNSAAVILTRNMITNNKASPFPATGSGGGGGGAVFNNSPESNLSNNTISNNRASSAGGLSFSNSQTATLISNTVSHNTANHIGGGTKHYGGIIFSQSHGATLIGNTISGNVAANDCAGVCFRNSDDATLQENMIINNIRGAAFLGYGIGVYIETGHNMTLISNTISHNTGQDENNLGAILGGGLYSRNSTLRLIGNKILSNHATRGGGLYLGGGQAKVQLTSNIITGNMVHDSSGQGYGGGLYIVDGGAISLTNTLIADNQTEALGEGSGLYILNTSPQLRHTTLARNHGGDGSGIHISGTNSIVALTNTIIAHHAVGITVTIGNRATITGILWYSNTLNYGGEGTIVMTGAYTGNPAFDEDGYHLTEASAAIDRGVDSDVSMDIDGDPRPMGQGYDIGADEFPAPLCEPVSEVHLSRLPAGDLVSGTLVHFTAQAKGSIPLTHTWTIEGVTAGDNKNTLAHTFATSGTFTVAVQVTNACGEGSATVTVEIHPKNPNQPLVWGYKLVNLTNVDNGDILTYTLVLRNNSAVTATATLTDPIPPAYTTYIPDSAQASSGNLTLTGGDLGWSGEIISGTPVVIMVGLQVQTTTIPVGAVITNVAYLDDGVSNPVSLTVQSTFNPGYSLTINDGALYTNVPTVTLRYAWNVGDAITAVKISNDGGFASEVSPWLPIDPENPVITEWVLTTFGDLTLPRTVYAKFRDANGQQFGPVQDDIIYDPGSPQIIQAEIIDLAGQTTERLGEQTVIVRVTANDDNSGVSQVQLSDEATFASPSTFDFTNRTIDLTWTLSASNTVYIRVLDRAGNLSPVSQLSVDLLHKIYLPVVLSLPAGDR